MVEIPITGTHWVYPLGFGGGFGGGCVSLNPMPRMIPIMVPMPEYDAHVTIVTVDKDGNVAIEVDQPKRCPRCKGNGAECDCE